VIKVFSVEDRLMVDPLALAPSSFRLVAVRHEATRCASDMELGVNRHGGHQERVNVDDQEVVPGSERLIPALVSTARSKPSNVVEK
jgi:hypothetical protein